jgi:hypothetical protein
VAYSEQDVLEQLRGHGITTMDELAKAIADQSAAKARFMELRGVREDSETDYIWSGKNYSLYHLE